MKTPEDMLGVTGVISKAFSLIFMVELSVGVLGYLRFGEDQAESITLKLPQQDL